MKYFEVSVDIKLESEDPKGNVRIKKIKEVYLVDALSVTEAEARVVKLFSQSGYMQDYEVVAVKGSKVVEVVSADTKLKPKVENANQLAKEKDDLEDLDEKK
jgi:ribosomal protein S8